VNGFQKPQSRGTNGSFELNLPLRFGKNQMKRNIQMQAHNVQTGNTASSIDGPSISAATKNAWQAIEFNQTRREMNGTFAINSGQVNQ